MNISTMIWKAEDWYKWSETDSKKVWYMFAWKHEVSAWLTTSPTVLPMCTNKGRKSETPTTLEHNTSLFEDLADQAETHQSLNKVIYSTISFATVELGPLLAWVLLVDIFSLHRHHHTFMCVWHMVSCATICLTMCLSNSPLTSARCLVVWVQVGWTWSQWPRNLVPLGDSGAVWSSGPAEPTDRPPQTPDPMSV